MKRALIGYTGFVGSNLNQQQEFTHTYNSSNIEEIREEQFDEIYFAGLPAAKWKCNLHPEDDIINVARIINNLREVSAGRFILISTVDVYKEPNGVDEDTPILYDNHHAYGIHRRIFENFVREKFLNHFIIRLPGLFGDGLKKNIIYDFLNDNQTDKINAPDEFQFYYLDRLSDDIKVALQNEVRLLNIATPPVSVRDVVKAAFGRDFDQVQDREPIRYDMKTKYGELFGAGDGYIMSRQDVLNDLREFVQKQ